MARTIELGTCCLWAGMAQGCAAEERSLLPNRNRTGLNRRTPGPSSLTSFSSCKAAYGEPFQLYALHNLRSR